MQQLIERRRKKINKSHYKEAHCPELVAICEAGGTKYDFCLKHGLTITDFNEWVKKFKKFADAADLADQARIAWLTRLVQRVALKEIDGHPLLLSKLFDKALAIERHLEGGDRNDNSIKTINKDLDDEFDESRILRINELKKQLLEAPKDVLEDNKMKLVN